MQDGLSRTSAPTDGRFTHPVITRVDQRGRRFLQRWFDGPSGTPVPTKVVGRDVEDVVPYRRTNHVPKNIGTDDRWSPLRTDGLHIRQYRGREDDILPNGSIQKKSKKTLAAQGFSTAIIHFSLFNIHHSFLHNLFQVLSGVRPLALRHLLGRTCGYQCTATVTALGT